MQIDSSLVTQVEEQVNNAQLVLEAVFVGTYLLIGGVCSLEL